MDAQDSPRRLARQWAALLLAPLGWAAALGIMFPLTADACTRNARGPLWAVEAVCILLALAGAWLAWRDRLPPEGAGSVARARFMRDAALGLSAIFLLVLLVMAVPVLFLGACRT